MFQVQECNVLFIDSPVGSGWSYVDDPQYYTKDMAGITSDLTATLKMFLADTPELEVRTGGHVVMSNAGNDSCRNSVTIIIYFFAI